ncbi:MAG: hypothetical protein NXI16_06855 [Alphaproteobacteria bacterium]|nr:hypothetical protein [Alphaproteobacteria bacterium]
MRSLYRLLAAVFLILAAIALGADLMDYAETGRFELAITGQRWAELHFTSLQQAQPFVQRHLVPWLWDPVFTEMILLRPAALVAVVFGVAFHFMGKRRS